MKTPIQIAVAGLASFAVAIMATPPMASAGAVDIAAYVSSLFTGGALANAQQGGYNFVAPAYQSQTASVQPACHFEKQWVHDPYIGAKIQKSITVCN